MQTSQLIDIIKEYVDSGLTRARALVYLNNAQNELLVGNNRLMRVYPDPFLTTVAATYQYDASTTLFDSTGGVKGTTTYDIYNVSKIYSYTKGNEQFNRYNGYGNAGSDRPYTSGSGINRCEFTAPADVIKSIAPASVDCSIIWWEDNDPGATTIDWKAECYRYPNQLGTEAVAMECPSQYQDTLLLWMVLKRLEIRQFGTSNKDNLIIPEMRKFKQEIMTGSKSRSRQTPVKDI